MNEIKQINQTVWQVCFNPNSKSHLQLMDWINEQTTNRSSFIRETLMMRMVGSFRVRNMEELEVEVESQFDEDEALRVICV